MFPHPSGREPAPLSRCLARPPAPFFSRGRAAALALLLCSLFAASQAAAHGLYIFAWADGGRVCTESYFSKSSKVRGGEVGMTDAAGRLLASGRSDDAGELCFPLPEEAGDLLFTVNAGQGHRAEFLLPAQDVAEALAARQPGGESHNSTPEAAHTAAEGPTEQAAFAKPPAPAAEAHNGKADAASLTQLREVLREELARELAPVRKALAGQTRDSGPSLKDIIGGLGWIAGLAGIGALYAARRKRD